MSAGGKKNVVKKEKIVKTLCNSHCGGQCLLKVHVKDGFITRIETDDGEEPQIRACLRGRAYRQRVYAPDRLKYPMRSTGTRGEGKFKRISWDEALDIVASELIRVRDMHSPGSIILRGGGGDLGWLQSGAIDPVFSDRIFKMKAGDVSEPFQTSFGYHVVKILEPRQVVKRSFESVKGDIRYKLRSESKQAEMARLLTQVTVEEAR